MNRVRIAALLLALPLTALAQNGPPQRPEGRGPGGGGFGQMGDRFSGEVTAISGTTFTIKAADGTVSTVTTTDNTRIMKTRGNGNGAVFLGGGGGAGQGGGFGQGGGRRRNPDGNPASGDDAPQMPETIKAADIHVGDGIGGGGQTDPNTHVIHAFGVFVTDAATVKAMRDNLGKTYISGKVTAIDLDNAKLTVERPDKVVQVITLDDSTSFRRPARGGGEAITLADIKVGDTVTGRGQIKSGSFVPAELNVIDPAMMGQGRRRPEGTTPPPTQKQ